MAVLRSGASLKHGTFVVASILGRGGFGEVYLARQPRMDRDVAIKVLSPSVAEEADVVRRFEREALAAGQLLHPNVLPVFDFDFDEEEGIWFLAMQYVPGGRTLQSLMNSPIHPAEVARIIGEVGSALDAAHNRGIIHRDVKPPNVLMDGPRPMLTDFGIAHLGSMTGITARGMAIGTPAYVSPEQGQGKLVGPASDQYSLAVMTFQMLTSRPPFTGDSLSLVMQHVSTVPPPVSMLNPMLPPGISPVVARALSKAPEDRFATCGEFAAALAEAAGRAPGISTPPSGFQSGPTVSTTTPSLPAGSAASMGDGVYLGNPTVVSESIPGSAMGNGVSVGTPVPRTVVSDAVTGVAAKKALPMPAILSGVAGVLILLGVGLGLRQLTSAPAATDSGSQSATATGLLAVVSPVPSVVGSPLPDPNLIPIDVRSSPVAAIFVDNESAGATPKQLRLQPGTHELRLVAPSYEDATQTIDLKVGETTSIPVIELAPSPAAKVINPEDKALGTDPYVAGQLIRVSKPTDTFRVGDDINAIVYVAPLTNGIRDLGVDYVWKMSRPGGQPPLELKGSTTIPSAWQHTFLRTCVPGLAADAAGSNAPVDLELLIDGQSIETFTFRVGPGPANTPSKCDAEMPVQSAPT